MNSPRERALASLEGLSMGDAFGAQFFRDLLLRGVRPDPTSLTPPPWTWTDDTAMAVGLVRVLLRRGEVVPDELAGEFSQAYRREPMRGYGMGMHDLLPVLEAPGAWRLAAPRLFSGQGSLGNGAAMRVAPLGAFFADNLDRAARQAELSAVVTHAHPEGVAGAVAVAVAAAVAWQTRQQPLPPGEFLRACLDRVPAGPLHQGLMRAQDLGPEVSVGEAARELGSGRRVTAADTVPFVLWNAARCPADFSQALWNTVTGEGDMDTTCAMVGGILGAAGAAPPADWLAARESLPPLD
ncbi:MAG: ADP-ribosylglycohydrolase family protein [Candidatus Eremiobacterota bacterium]